jgi:expansin
MFEAVFKPAAGRVMTRRCASIMVLFCALIGLIGVPQSARADAAALQPSANHLVNSAAPPRSIFLPIVMKAPTTVPGLPFDPYATRSGEATYYDATGAGNCSFDPTPNDLMVGAMNQTDYAGSLLCGAYVQISGPNGVVVVRIVDRCPECPAGNIDLSQEAFARIANLSAGRVPITWRIVSPALNGPIVYRFKEGSSQWWTAVQLRNHRNPIAKFEYLDKNGQFKTVPREDYNYFVESSGMGPGPYTFRVTDSYGNVLTDSGIALKVAGEVAGSAQFPREQ